MRLKLFSIILFYFIRLKYKIKVILNYFSLFIINIKLFLTTPRKGMIFCIISTLFFQYYPTWDGMISVNASPIR